MRRTIDVIRLPSGPVPVRIRSDQKTIAVSSPPSHLPHLCNVLPIHVCLSSFVVDLQVSFKSFAWFCFASDCRKCHWTKRKSGTWVVAKSEHLPWSSALALAATRDCRVRTATRVTRAPFRVSTSASVSRVTATDTRTNATPTRVSAR